MQINQLGGSQKALTLLPETRLDRYPLATFGAAAGKNRTSALGLHARPEAVSLRAVTTVGLECALGHESYLLLSFLIAIKGEAKV
jgi:hypothetical protein